ncbi:MAG TPA: hypothetical protein ENK11_10170 [Phycisphaerales bacterium]|nr:hypothetical protein [Phycisphaerales bacterium]
MRRWLGGLFMFVLFAGMLFWTKLRLVSDIPRSAYAEPREKQADQPPRAEDEQPAPDAEDEPSGDERPGG